MSQLILLRHGQSLWNLENRFTGCVDVSLSPAGELEAMRAGKALSCLHIDRVYTSVLKRAIQTADIIFKQCGWIGIERIEDASLNERNYGDLQGLNKLETARKYGIEQVQLWRRSFKTRPPNGESLADTAARTLPFFNNSILADVKSGLNVLVVAHGNSLRSIVMSLDQLSETEIVDLNIPTGIPLIYEIDEAGVIQSRKYLNVFDDATATTEKKLPVN